MTKVDQQTASDCMRCCIAMVLGLSYDDVPDFLKDHPPNDPRPNRDWLKQMVSWAFARGYHVLRLNCMMGGELLAEPFVGGPAWIASGPASRGRNHAVVYVGSEPWHDPHESRDGLRETTTATMFVRIHLSEYSNP